MSGREEHPAVGGLCLWDTCSGCGDDGSFERGYDPSHLCTECDEALTLLHDPQPANVARVTPLRPTRSRWFHTTRRVRRP